VEIKLPDYKNIASKIKKKEVTVEEEEIEKSLKWLQQSRAKFSLKNAPAEKGDFIEIEYQINKQGSVLKDGFILGQGHFVPGFEENLIGLKSGEEKKDFILNQSGKESKIDFKLNSVQKVEFPEINDQFARSLGDFENLDNLKNSIKNGIALEKKRAEEQRRKQEILEKIGKETEVEIPVILIENEKNKMLEDLKKLVLERLKFSWEEYLKKIKKTEKEILNSFEKEAQSKIKNFLILEEIGKREKIEVPEQEITEEVNKVLRHFPSVKEAEKNIGLDLQQFKEYTKIILRNNKIFEIL